jgi:ABC-type amino acid transport substrate-binding protein
VTADDGTMSGVDLRIARGIARRLGVEPHFVRTAKTTDALVRQAAVGDVDIAISFVSRTLTRAMQVRFSRPYITEQIGFALNRRVAMQAGVDCPKSPDDLVPLTKHDWKIGAQRGTIFQTALEDKGLKESTSLFDSLQDMLAAVQSGTHLGGLAGEVALRYALNEQPGLRIKIKLCLIGEQKDHIAIAIRPDAPNLKDFIDIALDNVDLQLDASGVLDVDSDWDL